MATCLRCPETLPQQKSTNLLSNQGEDVFQQAKPLQPYNTHQSGQGFT